MAYEIYNRAPININLDNYISDQVYTDELLNEYYSDHADDYSDYDWKITAMIHTAIPTWM